VLRDALLIVLAHVFAGVLVAAAVWASVPA
jgi:hypothetical protein